MANRPPTKEAPWTGDPLGDFVNAHAIPEDAGLCLLCFGDKEIDPGGHGVAWRGKGVRCPLCKGTGVQSPETVRAYKHGELNLNLLVTLE